MPPRSSTVTFRPYASKIDGRRLLDCWVETFATGFSADNIVILYHDEIDRKTVEPFQAWGALAIQSFQTSRVKALAEVAVTFPQSTLLTAQVESVLAPRSLPEHVLSIHREEGNHFTYTSGIPLEVGIEVFEPELLSALWNIEFVPGMDLRTIVLTWAALRAGEIENKAIRTAAVHVAVSLPDGGFPARVLFGDVDDAARALDVMTGVCDIHRLRSWCNGEGRPAHFEIPPVPKERHRPRVLYHSPSSGFSGAEESLCLAIECIDNMEQIAAVSFEGLFTDKLRALGCTVMCPNRDLAAATEANSARCLALLTHASPDVVHCNDYPGEPMLEALRHLGIPMVQHVRLHEIPALKRSLLQADAVVAISNWVADRLRDMNIDQSKIHLIYNGIDTERFRRDRFDRDAVRESFDLRAGDFVVLMVARLEPYKRHDLAVKAAALLRDTYPHLRIIFLGEGWDSSYGCVIGNLILLHGLEDTVICAPFQQDVRPLMAAADVLLLPSDGEPLGRCILEAMAMQVPAIVTRDGGQQELVVDDSTGFVLPNGDEKVIADAIGRLIENTALRVQFGAAARSRVVSEFGAAKSALRLQEVLSGVASRSGKLEQK